MLVELLTIALLCVAPRAQQAGEVDERPLLERGGTAIFDGRSLEGWQGIGAIDPRDLDALAADERAGRFAEWTAEAEKHWRVEDGVLVCDGEGPFLATARDYGDFELELEYQIAPGGDSGVYLRGSPQVQIWDHTDPSKFPAGAEKGSGGLWNNTEGESSRFPLLNADNPVGEWNRLRVIMVGARTTVWLNGKLVVDHAVMENAYDARKPNKRPLLREGPIILQTHGGETRWRKLVIREIGVEEANSILRRGGPAGSVADADFEPIFNGVDFTGWRGPIDQNAIEDGAILSSHGTLYTEQEYEDFVVRLEFQLPPRGNNGLAIRYPGQGDPAYEGMCEIQIIDTPGYAGQLGPMQVHGSAYGMFAAEQGYLRPTGEWNYQEVTVQGSRIRVEINGTPILDCDLAQVRDTARSLEQYRGRLRTHGHFGVAGHGDPVRFRNLAIKRL